MGYTTSFVVKHSLASSWAGEERQPDLLSKERRAHIQGRFQPAKYLEVHLVFAVRIFVAPEGDFIVSARVKISEAHRMHALLCTQSEVCSVYRIFKAVFRKELNKWLDQRGQVLQHFVNTKRMRRSHQVATVFAAALKFQILLRQWRRRKA
jgi:hypothetical protein